ncbi:E3 SUMO-protein ligase RanBP2 isoform X2 [Nilaparvata lugens]|nr:E3 SUMO-protein ligase RanBP2 isoform X2 [Nilaparvata lugens]
MFNSPPRSDSSILRYLDDVIVQIPKQVSATATIHPGSLHHLVWLGVQGMRHAMQQGMPQRGGMPLPPHDFHTHQLFAALAICDTSVGNDTVTRLDVDSFLYAAVLCASAQLCNEIKSGFYSLERPITLPADITCQLCSPEQANWWNAVHKIYSKQMTSRTIVDAKWDLLRGIEVIRAVGNHGLDPILLAALAQTFTERAMSFYTSSLSDGNDYISPKLDPSSVHDNAEVGALESRANLYWKAALPLLERMRAGKALSNPVSRLFDYQREEVDSTTLATLIEEGNLFVARQLMANEEYEEAVEAFKSLRSPYASYHTAEVYLKLASDAATADSVLSLHTSESGNIDNRAKQTALLEKARDALYVTRDRLHTDLQHPLHRVLAERIRVVEARLDDTEEFLSPSGSPLGPALADQSLRIGRQAEMNGSANKSQRQLNYLNTSTPRSRTTNSPRPAPASVVQQAPAALGPEFENLLQASETRLQDAFKLANTAMSERLESIVETIMSKLTRLEVSVDEIRRDVAKMQHPDDLYMLGDDEDYTDDIISFPTSYVTPPPTAPAPVPVQPPPTTPAAYYGVPPPATNAYYGATTTPSAAGYYGAVSQNAVQTPRGVQGTNTVTYGAPVAQPPVSYSAPVVQPPPVSYGAPVVQPPPVSYGAPVAQPPPAVQPQYYTPPPQFHHQPSQAAVAAAASIGYYGQGALPFSEGQQLPDFLRPAPVVTKSQSPIPVNVVITSSDTLPTGPPPVLPTLSVTIPPKHRLGGVGPTPTHPLSSVVLGQPLVAAPHEFQITMPASANIPSIHNPPLALQQDEEELESRTASPEVEHDPYPDFKPIIPLPDEVTPTTGEEDEHVLFENRAKLFRFVDREWKERGLGMLKLLEDKSTKKVRLLMRREQVHKICANHYVTKDMTLNPMPNTDKAWAWSANDFAEETLQRESFCVRFKTADEAANFKDAFEAAQQMLSESANCSQDAEGLLRTLTVSDVASSATTSTPQPSKITLGGFTFTSTPTMKPTDDKGATKQAAPVASAAATTAPNPFNAFTFTPSPKVATTTTTTPGLNILKTPIFSTPTGPQLFLNKSTPEATPTEAAAKGDILLKSALKSSSAVGKSAEDVKKSVQIVEDVKKSVQIVEDVKVAEAAAPTKGQLRRPHKSIEELVSSESTVTPSFIEKSSGAVDFAALAKSAASSASGGGGGFKKSDTFKGFEGTGSLVFGKPEATVADEDGAPTDDFVPTAEFKPVIPLPQLVMVQTGEEEERVLYEQRAKLLRFDTTLREWKERGVGKMKILHNPNNGTVRFLMRREQVFKVCCNHRITADFKMKLLLNSDKAWSWFAQDYSEGTATDELFALRFKTVELAGDFKAAVDDAVEMLRGNTSLGLSDVSSDTANLSSSCAEGSSDEGAWPGPVKITEIRTTTTPITKSTKPQQSLSEMFKPKAGSWECSGCLVRNNADVKKCPACGTMKEGEASSPKPQQSLSEMFKPKAGSWECGGCLVRNNADVKQCPACSTWRDGVAPESSATSVTSSSTSSTLTFAENVFGTSTTPGTGFTFGIPPSSTPSTEAPKFLTTTTTSTTNTSFSFGIPPASQTSTASPPKFSFGNMFASNTPSAQSVVSNMFGGLAQKKGDESSVPITPAKTSVFGDVSSSKPQEPTSIFGGGSGQTTSTPKSNVNFSFAAATGKTFVFQGQGDSDKKFEFNFTGVHTPKQPKSPGEAGDTDGESDGEGHDESNDSIVFHPVIPLPDQVPVTTGEEDETALYTHRAKLFRFVDGEWKERGLGDVKILKHNKTGKLRLLMRREMILKVCLNHFLTDELNFQPKDDKTWLWCAIDYSEGEVAQEKFALRFKTADIAGEFKDALDRALADLKDNPVQDASAVDDSKPTETMNSFSFSLPNTQQTTSPPQQAKSPFSFSFKGGSGSATQKSSSIFGGSTAAAAAATDSDDDVEVVFETTVTAEEREAALKLQLPPTFYAYKQAPPCPGCIGCDPEDRKQPVQTPSKDSPKATAKESSNKSSPLAAPVLNFGFAKPADSPQSNAFGFDSSKFGFSMKKADQSSEPSTTPVFGAGTGTLFGETSTSEPAVVSNTLFGKTSTASEPSATPIFGSGGGLFGKSTTPNTATPSIFGKPSDSEKPSVTPIFGSGAVFGKIADATSTTTTEASATPIFGSGAMFSKPASVKTTSSTWNIGTTATAGMGMLFGGGGTTVTTASNNNQNVTSTTTTAQSNNNNGGPGFLFKDAASFSSLASTTGGGGFKTAPENFKWDSTQPVFGGLKSKSPKATKPKEKADADDNEEEEEGEDGEVQNELFFIELLLI